MACVSIEVEIKLKGYGHGWKLRVIWFVAKLLGVKLDAVLEEVKSK
jgi:hypothetical protein